MKSLSTIQNEWDMIKRPALKMTILLLLILSLCNLLYFHGHQIIKTEFSLKPLLGPNTAICPDTDNKTKRFTQNILKSKNRIKHHPSMFNIMKEPRIVCNKNVKINVEILAYVFTRNSDQARRDLIRRTWTNRTLFPTLFAVFPVGLSSDPNVNNLISKESEKNGDILQGDFIESYNNLTFKTLISWQWIFRRCDLSKTNGIRTIMKADDDVVINTPFLIRNLSKIEPGQFACRVLYDSPIIRNVTSEYFMSFIDFPWPRKVYQKYCAGAWFLFNSDLLEQLYKISELNYGFRHDDVYVGMVASCIPSLSFGLDRRSWQLESFYGGESDLRNYLAVFVTSNQDLFLSAWKGFGFKN
jgi:hypothetical protein